MGGGRRRWRRGRKGLGGGTFDGPRARAIRRTRGGGGKLRRKESSRLFPAEGFRGVVEAVLYMVDIRLVGM